MKKIIFTFILSIFIFSACTTNQWSGFLYPEGIGFGVDESKWQIEHNSFSSLEECRNWANALIEIFDYQYADYECGRSCKLNEYGMYACKETLE